MNVSANLWKLYALRFFQNLIPAYVIERLFWEARGMTIPMVVYTEILYALTIVLLEIPTGVMADRWGRKRLLVLAAGLGCLEFLILLFADRFWHFALVVILAGIGRSAGSGAESALLYDTLFLQGSASAFEKHLGRLNACDLLSAILAALCGSLLAGRFGLELNYWLSLGSATIGLLIAAALVEPIQAGGHAPETERIPMKHYAAASLRFFHANPRVSLVVLTGMVTGASLSYIGEFWQLHADRLGIPVAWFGLLSTAMMLLQLPGNLLAHALIGRFRTRTLLLGVLLVFTAGFAYAAWSRDYTGLAAMLLICLFAGVVDPIAAGYLHHRIDSPMRATLDSFRSLGENGVHIAAGLGFGWFAARFDVFGGYGFIALLCGVCLIGFTAASRGMDRD